MVARADTLQIAGELARGLTQLWALGLLSEGGRGGRVADRLEVVRDAYKQTESGALAGYGASDTLYALDIWRMIQRMFEGGQATFTDMDNQELAAFLEKVRKATYGPQVSSALARWLPPRIFISSDYTKQHLEKLRPASARGATG
ncbi:MAG TPA: hypothetical protein VM536_02270, partial [Chloroflexia bacterium]|nr:hypothetical protein [Chloroflexia bacterium]